MLTEVTKGTLTQKRREVQRLHSAVLCPSTFNDILGGVEVKLLFHFEKSLEKALLWRLFEVHTIHWKSADKLKWVKYH